MFFTVFYILLNVAASLSSGLEPLLGVAPQLLQCGQPLGSGRRRRNEQPADRHRSDPAGDAVAPAGALRLLQWELQATATESEGGQSHAEA